MLATLGQILPVVAARVHRARPGSPAGTPRTQWDNANTKATLVEPILRAIGWDLDAEDQVSRGVKLKRLEEPVDYVLRVLDIPQLLIEVVPLGTGIHEAPWLGRLFRCAESSNLNWVVVTNGDDYHLYRVEAAVSGDDGPFRAVQLSQGDFETAEATFELLSPKLLELNRIEWVWQMHARDRKVRNVIEMLFGVDPGFAQLVSERSDGLSVEEVRGSLRRAHIAFDHVADARRPVPDGPSRKPKDLMTEVELRIATLLQRKALERWSRGRDRASHRADARRLVVRRDASYDRRVGPAERRAATLSVETDRRRLRGDRRKGQLRTGMERRSLSDRRHATMVL